jgi:hypothetical protein
MIPPAPRQMAARVCWGDWARQHDWVGRRLLRDRSLRRPPPHTESRYFRTRELAEQFAARLRAEASEEAELFVEVVDVAPAWPRPQQLRLSDDWPMQRAEEVISSREGLAAGATSDESDFRNRGKSCAEVRTVHRKSTRQP